MATKTATPVNVVEFPARPAILPVQHTSATQFTALQSLRTHPKNPRNHDPVFMGVPVFSSVDIPSMVAAIQERGDITTPLLVAGDNCHSPRGTVYKGNRRLEACYYMGKNGILPVILQDRGIPVEYMHGLTEEQETVQLNDHGTTRPLNPTECLRSMLNLYATAHDAEDILFQYGGLLGGFMGKLLDPIPAGAKERKDWFDGYRDTLYYNVLCWGIFPQKYLPDVIRWCQINREKAYKKDNAPTFEFFKPLSSRAKELYSAYLSDNKGGQWGPDGGPKFNALVDKFHGEDFPVSVTTGTETTTLTPPPDAPVPLAQKKIEELRASTGKNLPIVDTILGYVLDGENKPEGLTVAIQRTTFALALVDYITGINRPVWASFLPVAVLSAIDAGNANAVNDAIMQIGAEQSETKPVAPMDNVKPEVPEIKPSNKAGKKQTANR